MLCFTRRFFIILPLFLFFAVPALAEDVKKTDVYARIKKSLDAVAAIDTHSHLGNPGGYKHFADTQFKKTPPTDSAMHRLWRHSYFTWGHPLAPWPKDGNFDAWWTAAQKDFNNSRARSAYRAMLPIFTDLYGVDFEKLTPEQAKKLNERMEKNCDDPNWAEEILVKKANTELIVCDSYIMPRHTRGHYPFTVSACNVRWYINGFHPTEFKNFPSENPYTFAEEKKLPIKTLDEYVAVIDQIIADAKKNGAVCLKNQSAYDRTLQINWVSKERAEKIFGKPRKELKPHEVKDFQDYMFWRLAELAAKHNLPLQIHTGHARIPGSNPMNLVPLISGNRKTKFVLFHGGFPWVGETGMVALKYPNVYIDSVWLPTLSYTMGKRAFREWLEMISSDRIMWGSDLFTIEGSYGTTIYARQCIYETLAEMVIDHQITEEEALHIGRQILRENALNLYPTLRDHLKKK